MVEPSTPMPLSSLIITQHSVRNKDCMEALISHASNGGKFKNIYIMTFPDGQHFIHDGHHR
jgi:hypothetical protein